MKWRKLGKIFDPTAHVLANGCKEFAQSPQTLVFGDFVRIYFSTRKKDENTGKYLSHISYVDMDKQFKNILRIAKDTVIDLGELGCFDEHGIFPINVLQNGDDILAFTCGWSRRVSVSVETSIGMAVSKDKGMTFEKIGSGPLMSSSLHEPFLVGDAFVRVYGSKYHMWYIFGQRWIENPVEETARVYKIGHAISDDGKTWVRDSKQIIPDKLNADECQALPTVIFTKNRYHMFFCYREAIGFRKDPKKGYRIGYAFSDDLVKWVRDDTQVGIEVSEEGWDADMMCYPHVFEFDGNIYMLYNGNEFGRYGFGLAVLEG
jgi:predicted GH43/DUF377 family glycosyl hydrolase